MTRGALEAAIAGVLAVIGAWEALGALAALELGHRARELLTGLARAGRDGREPTGHERRQLATVAATTLLIAGWLVSGPLVGVALAAGGPWLALALVRHRRRRQAAELARAAPLVARSLADALSGGHSVRGALGAAAASLDGAAGRELRAVAAALAVGESTDSVLDAFRRRAPGPAYETIVAAILVQRDAGGDLAALLRGVASAQEESARLEHDAHAATAQARFTGFVVCALPLAAAGLTEAASPGYLATLLSSPLSALLAAGALLFQLGSFLAIRRLARVRA